MELRTCSHLHYIQAIKGGSVTTVPNVTHGRPTLSFKKVTDIYDGFDNITLQKIKESCKTRKRKHSHDLDGSSKRKIKLESPSSLEDYKEKQMAADDSDFMETKNRKCIKDSVSTYLQEIMPFVKSEEIQNDHVIQNSCADSATLVGLKFKSPETVSLYHLKLLLAVKTFEIPETLSLYHLKKLIDVSQKFSTCRRPDDCSGIVAKGEAQLAHESILDSEFNFVWQEHTGPMPLLMVGSSSTDIVGSNSDLTSDLSPNLTAMEFESEECIVTPDLHYISPESISLVEDHYFDIIDNQPDGDNPVSPSVVATDKGLDCVDDDSTFLGDCSKDEFTPSAKVQAKTISISNHGFNAGGCQVCSSDASPESEETQSFASICDLEAKHVTEATDELTSFNEHGSSSNQHHPKRLLSTRTAISPTSRGKLCKAMQSIYIHDEDFLKCREKLYFVEQTRKKDGTSDGSKETLRARHADNPNNISLSRKKVGKIPHPSHPGPHLSTGFRSVQSCSKSVIAFTERQMHGVERLTMLLTKELKSVKDILDDVLRSEFCLNTSLRYKVNEARMAVKNASRAENTAKRRMSIMSRDCSRFCKLMKLTDDGPPAPHDVVPKENKKIAFADEAGGRLCHVRFY